MSYEWIRQDISYCVSTNCPVKEVCHRKVGCGPGIHTIANFEEERDEDGNCPFFIEARPKDTKRFQERMSTKE